MRTSAGHLNLPHIHQLKAAKPLPHQPNTSSSFRPIKVLLPFASLFLDPWGLRGGHFSTQCTAIAASGLRISESPPRVVGASFLILSPLCPASNSVSFFLINYFIHLFQAYFRSQLLATAWHLERGASGHSASLPESSGFLASQTCIGGQLYCFLPSVASLGIISLHIHSPKVKHSFLKMQCVGTVGAVLLRAPPSA